MILSKVLLSRWTNTFGSPFHRIPHQLSEECHASPSSKVQITPLFSTFCFGCALNHLVILLANFGSLETEYVWTIGFFHLEHPSGGYYVFIVEDHRILCSTSYPVLGLISFETFCRLIIAYFGMGCFDIVGWIQSKQTVLKKTGLTLQKIMLGKLCFFPQPKVRHRNFAYPRKADFNIRLDVHNSFFIRN